jgi:glycosyltransferase involved in cell wall biosynthesis
VRGEDEMGNLNMHTFVVLVHKESPYLEKCIVSLKKQTVNSEIMLSTSTLSEYLETISKKYSLPVKINQINEGIAADWSFAYKSANTDFVTLAHQDDIYKPNYTESCLRAAEKTESLIVFTDYIENFKGKTRQANLLLLVKRLMLKVFFPFKQSLRSSSMKKLLISLGNPISCPTVMYNKKLIGRFTFNNNFSMNLDWEANFRFVEMPGNFVYINKKLLIRRIHGDSESTNALKDRRRHYEDRLLFENIWPKSVVKVLLKLYSIGYRSNG